MDKGNILVRNAGCGVSMQPFTALRGIKNRGGNSAL